MAISGNKTGEMFEPYCEVLVDGIPAKCPPNSCDTRSHSRLCYACKVQHVATGVDVPRANRPQLPGDVFRKHPLRQAGPKNHWARFLNPQEGSTVMRTTNPTMAHAKETKPYHVPCAKD